MASVSELIQLADHEARVSNPGASAVQSLLQGINQSQDDGLNRAMKLLQMEQFRQEQEAQKQMAASVAKQFGQAQESSLKESVTAAGVKPQPVMPKQKFEMSIEQDEKGRYSRKFKVVEPKAITYQKAEYMDAEGKARIGKFNSTTGEIIKSDADSLAAMPTPSVQFVGMQDGKPIMLNPKTGKMETGTLPGAGPLTSTTQTEAQANAKLFATRMEEANKQIEDISTKVDLTSVGAGLQGTRFYPNVAKSSEIQMFEQSKRNFINAVLRRESGAVISPEEFANGDKQYFPVQGDKPEVLAQKAQNRKTAIEGLRNAAGEIAIPKETSASQKTGTSTSQKIGRFEVTVEQ